MDERDGKPPPSTIKQINTSKSNNLHTKQSADLVQWHLCRRGGIHPWSLSLYSKLNT